MVSTVILYAAIAAIAIGVGLIIYLVFAAIPAKSDVVAVVAPPNEAERERVERATFSQTLAAVMPGGYTGWVQKKIIYAGRAGRWTVGGFLLVKLFITLLAVAIIIGALVLAPAPLQKVLGVAFGILLLIAPEVILNIRAVDLKH